MKSLGGLNPKNPKNPKPYYFYEGQLIEAKPGGSNLSFCELTLFIHYFLILKWVSMISCFLKEQNKVRRIYYYWVAS